MALLLTAAVASQKFPTANPYNDKGPPPPPLLPDEEALVTAARGGYCDDIERILDRGVSVELNIDGKTPIIYAALHGHADCVRTLLDRGADHRKEDDETGWTALIAAVAFNERSVVEVLLEAGANPMRTMRTENEANKGKHAIDIAELYNRKGEGSIKDLLYDYKEKRRLERIAKGDYQRKGIPPDRKGKYEL